MSEYTHGQKYRVDESSGIPARQKAEASKLADEMESLADLDYKRKHKLGKDQGEFKKEYKSSRDALAELNPFNFRKQLKIIKNNMTPEEYETVLYTIEELKANSKTYCCGFITLGVGFTYWQRHVLPRSFYPFALFTGVLSG